MTSDFYAQQAEKHGQWWSGDFSSWEEVAKECTGYDTVNILEDVRDAVLATKDVSGIHERDGCVIQGIADYSFNSLRWIVKTENNGRINLIDFGGSLGTTYFQLKDYLPIDISWNVIEQPHFVKCGKELLENNNLHFYESIDLALAENESNCFFSSSALPYIETAHEIIDEAISKQFEWIILDRISVIDGDKDRLTIQVVPECIYKAIYPCWFFSENKLVEYIKAGGYEHLNSFDALGGRSFAPRISTSAYRGFVFRRTA